MATYAYILDVCVCAYMELQCMIQSSLFTENAITSTVLLNVYDF